MTDPLDAEIEKEFNREDFLAERERQIMGLYEPGDYTVQVERLDPADRARWDALALRAPDVALTLRQAEAEAATVTTGWRADEPDHCRNLTLDGMAHALAAALGLGYAAGDRWIVPAGARPHPDADLPFVMLARIWDGLPPCRGKYCQGCERPWWIGFATATFGDDGGLEGV
jgi:hypothetical protein